MVEVLCTTGFQRRNVNTTTMPIRYSTDVWWSPAPGTPRTSLDVPATIVQAVIHMDREEPSSHSRPRLEVKPSVASR